MHVVWKYFVVRLYWRTIYDKHACKDNKIRVRFWRHFSNDYVISRDEMHSSISFVSWWFIDRSPLKIALVSEIYWGKFCKGFPVRIEKAISFLINMLCSLFFLLFMIYLFHLLWFGRVNVLRKCLRTGTVTLGSWRVLVFMNVSMLLIPMLWTFIKLLYVVPSAFYQLTVVLNLYYCWYCNQTLYNPVFFSDFQNKFLFKFRTIFWKLFFFNLFHLFFFFYLIELQQYFVREFCMGGEHTWY